MGLGSGFLQAQENQAAEQTGGGGTPPVETDLRNAFEPVAREYVENIRRSIPPKGPIGFTFEQIFGREEQAFAGLYKAISQGLPLSDAATEFIAGIKLERPMAPEEVLQGIGLNRETVGERGAEFFARLAMTPVSMFLFRPGKTTRHFRSRVKADAKKGVIGAEAGKLLHRGSLRGMSIHDQFMEGYRSFTGFRAQVPIPERLNKAIGRVEAPLVGGVADMLTFLKNRKVSVAALDKLNELIGTPAGSPNLRMAQSLKREGLIEELRRKTSTEESLLLNYPMAQNLLRQFPGSEFDFRKVLADMIQKPLDNELKAMSPKMWEMARMLEGQSRLQGVALANVIPNRKLLGETEFLEILDDPVKARKLADQQMNRALAQGSKMAADLTNNGLFPALDDGYLGGLPTEAGRKFFGITAEPGTVAYFDQLRSRIKDPHAQRKAFRHKDGSVILISEINDMAQKGTLPGFEGKFAKGEVFHSDPLQIHHITSLRNGRLLSRAQTLKRIGSEVGKPIKNAPEGWAPLKFADDSPFKGILDDVAFDPKVKSWAEGSLAYVNPEMSTIRTNGFWRMWDGINRAFVWMSVVPWPNTQLRNVTSEIFRNTTAGVYNPMSYARAIKLATGLEMPARQTLRWVLENKEHVLSAENFAKGAAPWYKAGRKQADVSGVPLMERAARRSANQPSRLMNPDLGDGHFQAWLDDPTAVGGARRGVISAEQIRHEAIANGILRQSFIRSEGFAKVRADREKVIGMAETDPGSLLEAFYGSKTAELSRNSFNVLGNLRRKGVNMAQSVPAATEEITRLAQFMDGIIEKGMTPKEAAAWTHSYHVDVTRAQTRGDRWIKRFVPFWRWQKFNVPKAMQEAMTRPWIPLSVWRFWESFMTQPGNGPPGRHGGHTTLHEAVRCQGSNGNPRSGRATNHVVLNAGLHYPGLRPDPLHV